MNKPKVIFCTDGIFPLMIGGMQRHSRLLIEKLAERDLVDLVVIHPHVGASVFNEKFGIQEIAIPPLPGKQNYLIELYTYSKEVFRILTKEHPDALIYSQGLSVWAGAKEVADRLIVNPHGLEPFQGLSLKDKVIGWPYRRIFGQLFNTARHSVALGGKLTEIITEQVKNHKKEIIILPNAVNLPKENQAKPDFKEPIKCLFVGRFAENKGIDVLMEAIQILQLSEHKEDFQFSLAGKGPLYEAYVNSYQFDGVEFLGFVPDEDLEKLYQDHHVFVLPTRFEGMPTVVLEAMSYGLPILVTDVGATKELVDEQNGYIIEKNSPEDIVNKLLAFKNLTNEQKSSLSTASVKKVEERFTWDAVAQSHEDLFLSMWGDLFPRQPEPVPN